MPTDDLNEREFELINIVGARLAKNQRDLSRHMQLSLGMTNMILRRMVTKGYIRIHQLNSRKVQYLLTPKGFSEKMRKSVTYTLKTIHSISLIKESLRAVLLGLYRGQERNFFVVGKSDLAFLIDVVLKEENLLDCQVSHFEDFPKANVEGIVLVCKEHEQISYSGRSINLIHELAKKEGLLVN